MKRITTFAAIGLMSLASAAYAQMAKKEVVIDTGKGGIELKISVPDIAQGPKDFSGNDGVFKDDYTHNGRSYSARKVGFVTQLGETGVMGHKVTLSKVSSKNNSDEGFTTKNTADYLLGTEGFKVKDANLIDNKFYPLDNATTETYKICGQPVFEKPKNRRECAIVVSAVTNDHLQSIGIMAFVVENDINSFDSNPSKYSNRVDNALKHVSESKATLKP